jgi:hypothetical protein
VIRPLPSLASPAFGFELAGAVQVREFRLFLAVLRRAVREHGRVSLLLDVSGLRSVEPAVVSTMLAFAEQDPHAVRRLVVVGEETRAAWTAAMAAHHLRTTTRWFRPDDRAKAEWFVQLPAFTPIKSGPTFHSNSTPASSTTVSLVASHM